MNSIENQPLKSDSLGETLQEKLEKKFNDLKIIISSLQNRLIPGKDNTIRSFDTNEKSVRISTVSDNTINTTILYETVDGFYYYHSSGNITEFQKLEGPQQTEAIINNLLSDAQNMRTFENVSVQKENNITAKEDLKHAEEYLDKELQKIQN